MKRSLAALRFPVKRTRGRRYPEPPHPYRDEFQRDRDRIIHARAFRRLEDKTQVFTPALSDHFRNRLTHTIEVAQIARTAASVLELNEQLTEALALAHDLGHPPFAHAGEEELNRQMSRFGDRFDHNLHALRIVEWFEQRYAAFPGLNLSFEVREGIAKHSRDFEPGEFHELDEYLPGLRPPLEAQLIDLADEIAYNTADLDDAFAAGMFDLDQLCAEVPVCEQLLRAARTQFPNAATRTLFSEVLRNLIDRLVSGLIEGTLVTAACAGAEDAEQVRLCPRRLAALAPETAAISGALKNFLRQNVYFCAELAEERARVSRMIGELFEFYLKSPESLPVPYQVQAESTPLHRVICDYIAGMTDGYFRRIYERTVKMGK